ncbi:NADP-dependent malic enzyme [candidate division WS5 bacterium]|uniref:NADP-dependent malic enzyme n=1 Tax=candidate division WS5 bacterium TaxID=2093353 RepID=A0A419DAX0_9BACT|nr:MAG: NADP-dependent malic enzyme [candidate division WS5 bacterium]
MTDPIKLHEKLRGKIVVSSKVELNEETLPIAYTPGVAKPCNEIAKDKSLVNKLTGKWNSVPVISDGSAVLGLGNIGPEAAMPVMEGKAAIFSQFAGINAVPICLDTQDTEEIIKTVKYLAPSFGGINLEDISAPRCFEIEKRLTKELDIPVFHDDQHGTAIVVLAGLINALKVVGKDKDVKIVISGAGAAGIAVTNLLFEYGLKNICMCDSKGVITEENQGLNEYKKNILNQSSAACPIGNCNLALDGADVLIGVSKPGQFTTEDIQTMNPDAIVFAMANPIPEIMPEKAKKGGAKVVATGRSDFPNQINNALVFPGLFRGLLDNEIQKVTTEIKIAVAEAIAQMIEKPTPEYIIPSIFEDNLVPTIANSLKGFDKNGKRK